MIVAKNINYGHKSHKILDQVDFAGEEGKLIAILGPNGAGKTSLLNYLANEVEMKKNFTFFKEKLYKDWKSKDLAQHKSKFSQHQQSDIPLTVKDIVLMGRYPYFNQIPEETDWDAIDFWMKKLEVNHLREREYVHLSGGEKQRVHLARVFVQLENTIDKKLVFLDEPLNNLDIAHQFKILQTVKEFTTKGNTAITILHDLNLAAQFSDEVVLMSNGKIVLHDQPTEVFKEEIIKEVYQFPCKIVDNPITKHPYIIFG